MWTAVTQRGCAPATRRSRATDAMTPRRLVLVGGGQAHLHVLRELARRPVVDVETIVVAADDHYHRAMMAGLLQGQYDEDDLRIDLASLATRAGARLVRANAQRIDVERHVVISPDEQIAFDVCSLDVGCAPAGADTPGVAEHAVALHSSRGALELRARVDAMIAESRSVAVVVVGAGRQGVEVALALHER